MATHIHLHIRKTRDAAGNPYRAALAKLQNVVGSKYLNSLRAMLREMENGGDEALAFSRYHFGAAQSDVRNALQSMGIDV